MVDIPVYGSIAADLAEQRSQQGQDSISVDMLGLGFPGEDRMFALHARGDSMIGCNILDGDLVILVPGRAPRPGDVVAAVIDNESTLKTFVVEKGRPSLRAENPLYPALIPITNLVIQGVMVALIRKCPPPARRKFSPPRAEPCPSK
jgi:repressor LexA